MGRGLTDHTDFDLGAVLDFYDVRFNATRLHEQSICCPIHEDRTPSVSLNLDKGLWNCFSCSSGGDAIQLIMLREVLDYEAALKVYQGITGTSGKSVRSSANTKRSGKAVPPGQGFKPRFTRIIPARIRRKTDFGS